MSKGDWFGQANWDFAHKVAMRGKIPSSRGGVDATSRKWREATSIGADGVVAHNKRFGVSDHPVCAASVASRHLLTGAATPPLEEGICPRHRLFVQSP
jgi:hypothetical protein